MYRDESMVAGMTRWVCMPVYYWISAFLTETVQVVPLFVVPVSDSVIPAKAGIQAISNNLILFWIPAFLTETVHLLDILFRL